MPQYESYHAHVYFGDGSRSAAMQVRAQLAEHFQVQLGRWHEVPVGPHPSPMYQVAFAADQFPLVVPWLMEHHGPLSVLIHPNSGDDLGDHSHRALWLGAPQPLRLDIFREQGQS